MLDVMRSAAATPADASSHSGAEPTRVFQRMEIKVLIALISTLATIRTLRVAAEMIVWGGGSRPGGRGARS